MSRRNRLAAWMKTLLPPTGRGDNRLPTRRPRRQGNRTPLLLEALEHRLAPAVYVGESGDFTVTTDTGPTGLSAGDTVTWNPTGTQHPAGAVAGLTFGGNAFTSIQDGVAAVPGGDTVNVTAGSYPENVVLNKQVTLAGARAGVDARGRVAGAPNPGAETVVAPASGRPLELQDPADNSTVDGFAFVGSLSGAVGVIESTTGATDALTLKNDYVAVASGFTASALFLNKSALDSTIDQNEFVSAAGSSQAVIFDGPDLFHGMHFTNNNVLRNGPATGTGLFIDGNHNWSISASLRTPLLQGNLFQGYATGVNLGSRSFGSQLTPNAGTISNNTFSNNAFDGLQGGMQNVLITRNTFSGNGRSGLALTSFGNTGADRGAQNTVITQNFFSSNTSEDLLFSATQAAGTISTNAVFNNSFASTIAVTYNETVVAERETLQVGGNWWGTSSNPEFAGKIGGASASTVDYSPWLNGGTDTDDSTAGFQGSLANLHVDDDSAFSALAYGTVTPVANRYVTEGIALLGGGPLTLNVHSGSYTENVDVNKALTFNPGDSPGIVNVTGNLVFSVVGSTLALEVNGTTPGPAGHDQVNVTGTVDLNGADNVNNKVALTVSSTTASNVLDLYDIITSGTAPVEGRFTNAGDTVVSSGTVNTFFISYNPGGNLVRLVSMSGGAPGLTYADDDWTGFANGQFILDVDPVVAGNQNGYFNVNAFDTIQGAVDAVAVGGTVKVNPHGPFAAPTGAYAESVSVAKALTLDGNGGATGTTATAVVIDPAAGDGITVSANNVTVQDLRVTGAADGLSATGVSGLSLTNVQADGNTDDGIDLDTLTGLAPLSMIVAGNNGDDGLAATNVNPAGTVMVSSSTFSGNGTATATGDGVQLTTAGAVTLTAVTANSNDSGVLVTTATSLSVSGGSYSFNLGHGIQLIDIATSVSVAGGSLNDNGGDGLSATDGPDGDSLGIGTTLQVSGNSIQNTPAANAQQRGVFVDAIGGAVTFGPVANGVNGHVQGGVVILDGGTTASFTDGTYSGNGGAGVALTSFSGNVTFSSGSALVASANADHGIRLVDIGGDVTLVRTIAENNDADDDGMGDGLNATASGAGNAIGGNLLVQAGRFRDTGGATTHQERGVFVQSVAGAVTFQDSAGPVQSVMGDGNEAEGVLIADGGTTATFTNGSYSGNGADNIQLTSFGGAVSLTGMTASGGATDGVQIDTAPAVVIATSSFSGNGTLPGHNGIELIDIATSITLTNVTANGNAGNGLDADPSGDVIIISGSFSGNDEAGIDLDMVEDVTLTGVTVNGNGLEGLSVVDALDVSVTNGSFSGNTGKGIGLDGVEDVTLTGVTVNGNGLEGLSVVNALGGGSATATLTGGTYSGNGGDGIQLTSFSATATLTNVTASGNGGDGAQLDDVPSILVSGGNYLNNQASGLRLYDGDDLQSTATVLNATIENNVTGIYVDGQVDPATCDGDTTVLIGTMSGNGNLIRTNGVGLDVHGGLVIARFNTFGGAAGQGNGTGVQLSEADAFLELECNNISFNGVGLNNPTAVVVEARLNWWGSASGPTTPSNPGGTGDSIIGPVNFVPWATDPSCSTTVGGVRFDPAGNVLYVIGTAGNDFLYVNSMSATLVQVRINSTTTNATVNAMTRLAVYGLAGRDNIQIVGTRDSEVHGGAGADTVTGGNGRDIIFGEAGDDNIQGGSGHDVLVGGTGIDFLSGGAGEDILVGGEFCRGLRANGGTDTYSYAVLRALSIAWAASPGGPAGGVAADPDLAGGLADDVDDDATDRFTGGTGRDWFIGNASDIVTDFGAGDFDERTLP